MVTEKCHHVSPSLIGPFPFVLYFKLKYVGTSVFSGGKATFSGNMSISAGQSFNPYQSLDHCPFNFWRTASTVGRQTSAILSELSKLSNLSN